MKKNLNEIIELKKILLIVTLLIIFIHSFNIFQLKKGHFLDETATFFYTNCKAISIPEAIDAIKNHTVNEYSAKLWDTFVGGHEYKTERNVPIMIATMSLSPMTLCFFFVIFHSCSV